MATLVSITNKKGGVGKTTSTILVTTALANLGFKVALYDCDNQSSAYQSRLIDKQQFGEVADIYPIIQSNPNEILDTKFIKNLSKNYDYVFFDIPRFTDGEGDDNLAAVVAVCDKIVIPVKSGQMDNLSTNSFLKMLKSIKDKKNAKNAVFDYALFLSLSGKRPTYDLGTKTFFQDMGVNVFSNGLNDINEFADASTYETLLDKSLRHREKFLPFFLEVCKFIEVPLKGKLKAYSAKTQKAN